MPSQHIRHWTQPEIDVVAAADSCELDAIDRRLRSGRWFYLKMHSHRDHKIALDTNRITIMTDTDLKTNIEGADGIFVLRSAGDSRGWNGIRYKAGLSAKNTSAKKLSMNVATIPPGGVAYAHIHVDFEVMLYILKGHVRHEYGPNLQHSIDNVAGDFIYIEAGIPHEVRNMSDTDEVVAVVSRSDASEWENIADYPSKRRPGATP